MNRTSVRDYIVKYCKKKREPLVIEYDDKQMRVKNLDKYTCDQIPHHAQLSDRYIKKGDVYYLYDFLFEPTIEVKKAEFTNEGRMAMLNAWKKLKAPRQMTI